MIKAFSKDRCHLVLSVRGQLMVMTSRSLDWLQRHGLLSVNIGRRTKPQSTNITKACSANESCRRHCSIAYGWRLCMILFGGEDQVHTEFCECTSCAPMMASYVKDA